MKLLLAYLSDRIELLSLDIECSHGCRNQIRCSFKCEEIVYYIIQSDFIPSGLFSTVLAGDVSMLQKPFRFALADMTNSVKLVSADDLWVFFV